jgi:hypothetical protein
MLFDIRIDPSPLVIYSIMITSSHLLNKLDTMDNKVPVFIAEISPKNLRGALTTVNQVNIYNRTNWRNTLFNKNSISEARNIFCCED